MRELTRTLLPVSAGALLAAGCGGDGALSRAQLVSRANAACEQAGARVRAIRAPRDVADVRASRPYFESLVPIAQALLRRLRDLDAPDELKSDYAAFLAAQSRGTDLLVRLRTAARADDPGRAKRLLAQLERAAGQTQAAANEAGLASCAR